MSVKWVFICLVAVWVSPVIAAPPYNGRGEVLALDAAIRAVCAQIDGVDSNGKISFQAGATCQDAANTVAQNFVPPPPIPTTVQINSTGTPAINGAYTFDATTTSKVMAVSLYIQVNSKFPAGFSTLPYPDASGTMHNFTSTALFQAFATALADYTTAISLGQSPSTPITIP